MSDEFENEMNQVDMRGFRTDKSAFITECKKNGKIVEYEKKYLFRLLADDTYELCLCLCVPGETFVIPSSLNGKPVTKIGEYAFSIDQGLVGAYSYDEKKQFKIVMGVNTKGMPTKSVEFPESFSGFDEHFRNWLEMFAKKGIKVTLNEKNPDFLLIDNSLYTKDGTTLLYAVEKTVIIPDGVTEVARNAFPYISEREWVMIPRELKFLRDTPRALYNKNLKFFYKGSKKEWKELLRRSSCRIPSLAIVYFYNESASASGDFWHFAKDGVTPEFTTSSLTKFIKAVKGFFNFAGI